LSPSLESYEKLLLKGHILRPHYAYTMLQTAKQAAALGYEKVSVIEFGCAGGSGLVDLECIASQIKKMIPIEFEIYGFDGGEGMPPSTDYRDVLYLWKAGEYKMDQSKLEKRLKDARLVVGDVKQTAVDFFEKYNPAPIGAVFLDMDYYTSTKACLNILKKESQRYLPRVFVYLDDTLGTSEYIGELLAVQEFNDAHEDRKISIQSLKAEYLSLFWKKWIYLGKKFYYLHCFDHKEYSTSLYKQANQLSL